MPKSTVSIRGQLRFKKACLVKKFQLPASFDMCMAYITGYNLRWFHEKQKIITLPIHGAQITDITIDNAKDFLMLVGKCVDYCKALDDRDSLQLLMYAVIRRVYNKRPYRGFDLDLLILIDLIIGDWAGIYKENKHAQVHDTAEIFKALLNYIESVPTKLETIKYQPPQDLMREVQERGDLPGFLVPI